MCAARRAPSSLEVREILQHVICCRGWCSCICRLGADRQFLTATPNLTIRNSEFDHPGPSRIPLWMTSYPTLATEILMAPETLYRLRHLFSADVAPALTCPPPAPKFPGHGSRTPNVMLKAPRRRYEEPRELHTVLVCRCRQMRTAGL